MHIERLCDSIQIVTGLLRQQSSPDQRDDVLFGKLDRETSQAITFAPPIEAHIRP